MNCVYYFSPSGKSREIAQYFADKLNCRMKEISHVSRYSKCDTAVVIFPVYCQNVPDTVRAALAEIKADSFIIVASYGRKSYGNVLNDAADIVNGKVIAAACVPTSHTYLTERGDDFHPDLTRLDPVLDKINSPREIDIPKCHKDFFADIFPGIRSRIGVRLSKNGNCSGCGICTEVCPVGAMHDGVPDKGCIRCMRCVVECPKNGLNVRYSPMLMAYLKNVNKEEYFILV